MNDVISQIFDLLDYGGSTNGARGFAWHHAFSLHTSLKASFHAVCQSMLDESDAFTVCIR